MQIIEQLLPLRERLEADRQAGRSVGLVPTMGALHEGHLALIRQAKAENDRVVVTVFVNPTQFTDAEDFEKYPRDLRRDSDLARQAGADYLFSPSPREVYPAGFDTTVNVGGLADRLEGKSRPGHFSGVATVVTKLFQMVGADRAYFGEKDWQQLQVIRRFTSDLNIPVEIIGAPTVREPDGLAMSSRNVRLSSEQRRAAGVLYQALQRARALAEASDDNSPGQIAAQMQQLIDAEPLARIDYAVVVHPETLQELATIANGALAALAVYFGTVRLIDNLLLRPATLTS